MRRTLLALPLAAALLAGCGSSGPGLAACEKAIRSMLAASVENPDGPAGKRPAACEGVGEADLERMLGGAVEDELGKQFGG